MIQSFYEKNRNVILIGGAPTTGKSAMAKMVSKHLGISWISTDQIRDIMRSIASRKEYPNLFTPEGYDAEKFLTEFSAKKIADMEFDQGEVSWIGIKK